MEIERIDENTVKLYLSYVDIEERGYTREEFWTDHTKGEELFWEMMSEIHEHIDFVIEGPLWIQVNAKEKGVEVTITKAKVDEEQFSGFPSLKAFNKPDEDEDDDTFDSLDDLLSDYYEDEWDENTFKFKDFEDVIQIASRMQNFEIETALYAYQDQYYLHVIYDEDFTSNDEKVNVMSVLSEFAKPSNKTIHLLKEYGTVVFESDVFEQIEKYFL